MVRRLSLGFTGFVNRLRAIEPSKLTWLLTLTSIWVIWTIYVWCGNCRFIMRQWIVPYYALPWWLLGVLGLICLQIAKNLAGILVAIVMAKPDSRRIEENAALDRFYTPAQNHLTPPRRRVKGSLPSRCSSAKCGISGRRVRLHRPGLPHFDAFCVADARGKVDFLEPIGGS